MPPLDETHISLGRNSNSLVVQIEGPCTAVACPRLKQVLGEYREPEVSDIYFDLSRAQFVDSTFVGLALSMSLAKRKDEQAPAVHMFGLPKQIHQTMEIMHVMPLIECSEALPDPIDRWEPVELPDVHALRATQGEMADTVIDAHEKLVEIDRRNEPKFRPVIEGLKALNREREDNSDPP